jgi:excinuclease ABC subunit C
MIPDLVLQKLDGLPAQPGVYLFKDKKGAVVYVGKAKSLRSRVRSYFQEASGDGRAFIPFLHGTVGDLETIVTANEKEATILENTLIKEYRPRYNVKLRDDKDFITLRLGALRVGELSPGGAAAWPRLEVVRRPTPDGARYFGPYHSATAARRTLHLVNKYFQLRTCGDVEFAGRKRPCLQYHIKRCPAPCVLAVDRVWYGEQVDAVTKFLDGRHDELSQELEDRMHQSAVDMRFELAAVYRDQLRAVDKIREEQRVVTMDDIDRDAIGLYREGELVEISLLRVRHGKLADVGSHSIKRAEVPDEEVVAAFLAQYYAAPLRDESDASDAASGPPALPVALAPSEIIVPCMPDGANGIAEWLSDAAGHKVGLVLPKRGSRANLLAMANDNACHSFGEKKRRSDDLDERLRDLQKRLRLASIPRRIECCDISHLGGGDTVGAIVAMTDGEMDKKRYRTFNVRGVLRSGPSSGVNDDYGSMYEVLARRFRRALAARSAEGDVAEAESDAPTEGDWDAPDLFVVDGGRGQLAVAQAAASDLGLHDLPIVALAKERETTSGEKLVDRVYLPGQKNPLPLKSSTTSLFLLARLRDEAHRFSNRARLRLGKKKRFRSPLEDVKGLGEPTRKALLKHVGNLAAIRAADDATLLAVPGVTGRHIRALRAAYPSEAGPAIEPVAEPAQEPTADAERQPG